MEDILIILIAFREWPKQRIQIDYRGSKFNNGLINLIKLLDFDKRFTFSKRYEVTGNAFSAANDFNSLHGKNLIVHVLLSTSGFYIIVLCLEMGIRYLFNDSLKYIFLLGLFWILLLLLSPIFFNYLNFETPLDISRGVFNFKFFISGFNS